ncbi:hypothetical protein [Methanobrevibacter wolinii]|uniref:hypothetical protein n=1 Tax=Methanobrevibacter wolinii TaxID=190977 RepID=UPI0005B2730A|nr:hypothetical protein [Methanobrevibacter wolinii]
MKKIAIIYGFISWIVTITLILMSHNSNPYIFNILLDLVLTVLALIIGINYLKGFSTNYFNEGTVLSVIIFLINICLDQIYYNIVGLPMGIIEYMLNVGFIYLLYPIIICTIGFLFDNIDTIIKN